MKKLHHFLSLSGATELNVLSKNIIDESVCLNKSLATKDWSDEDLAGISKVMINSMMSDILEQLLNLSTPQRLTVLRKAVDR